MEKNEMPWSSEEELKAENDFLKMKLMLENGAEFHNMHGEELPAAVENEFLKHIAAFEEQWSKRKTITVFEKIKSPTQFLPVGCISDEEIDNAWKNLWQYLQDHSIHIDHCSPMVTPRELYRFTTEELFQLETDDIDVPGMIQGYIYDEFHPDPSFDLCILVENVVFRNIFQKDPWHLHDLFSSEKIVFNEYPPMEIAEFKKLINCWKEQYSEIELLDFKVSNSDIDGERASLSGQYFMKAHTNKDKKCCDGYYLVKLKKEAGLWNIEELMIEGFDPF